MYCTRVARVQRRGSYSARQRCCTTPSTQYSSRLPRPPRLARTRGDPCRAPTPTATRPQPPHMETSTHASTLQRPAQGRAHSFVHVNLPHIRDTARQLCPHNCTRDARESRRPRASDEARAAHFFPHATVAPAFTVGFLATSVNRGLALGPWCLPFSPARMLRRAYRERCAPGATRPAAPLTRPRSGPW